MQLKHPTPVTRTARTGPLSEQELKARYYWLEQFVEMNNGVRPSMREIGVGWSVSVTAVGLCLDQFEERGWIEYARNDKGERLDRGLALNGVNG